MEEIELKILNVNPKELAEKLIERLGYGTNQTTSMTDTEIIKSYNVDYKSLIF